jgi:uncharacterized protein
MLFDFRVFLGQSFDGVQKTAASLLQEMDDQGVEMALACPLKPLSYDLNAANTVLAGAIKPHPDRLIGAARVDPWQPDACETLRRGFDKFGLRALYLNPWEEHFRVDMDMLDPLMEIAQVNSAPVIIAAGFPWVSESLQILKLARRWPDAAIVMTNGGQINITGLGQADATLALSRSSNLYIDTAGVYRQDFIEETIDVFGGRRVLLGSGSPYFDLQLEVQRVKLLKISEKDLQLVQSGNSKKLLGLKP